MECARRELLDTACGVTFNVRGRVMFDFCEKFWFVDGVDAIALLDDATELVV